MAVVDPAGALRLRVVPGLVALAAMLAGCGSLTADGGESVRAGSHPASSVVPMSHPRDRGLEAVDWGWSKDSPPDPASTTLHVGAYFSRCASGQAPKNPDAVVRYADHYVYIGVWAEPLESGAQTCPMGSGTPLTITLDEPIGTRKLVKDIPLFRHYESGSWELAEPVDPTS